MWPPNPQITGDEVHDAVAVGLWARAIERIHDDLTACPNITWVPDAPPAH